MAESESFKGESLIDCADAINEISECLVECSGEFITEIYNQVFTVGAEYIGDNLIKIQSK